MGEGITNEQAKYVFSWCTNSKVVYREGEGERGDLGKRLRESKWIMMGFNQISTTNKTFLSTPNHFTAYTCVIFLPSTKDPTAVIVVWCAQPLANSQAEMTRERDEVSVHHTDQRGRKWKECGGFGATIRPRKNKGGGGHREEEMRWGYCWSTATATKKVRVKGIRDEGYSRQSIRSNK